MSEMAIDLSRISYNVVALLSDGSQVTLDNAAENIAWEENEKELSCRLNLTIRDVDYGQGRLANALALCTVIYLYADWGEGKKEIFRGTVWEWDFSEIKNDSIVITVYDLLYFLKKSKDNRYYAQGTRTQTILEDIFNSWEVPIGSIDYPSVTHQKIVYKSKSVASMVQDTLSDALRLSGVEGIVRADKGKVYVSIIGVNTTIYKFSAETNLVQTSDKYSMNNLITRVVIVGKEDEEGRPKVEATLDGKTEYGILQDIQSIGSGTIEEARQSAKEKIREKGIPERKITLQSIDFPAIRKGDVIYATADNLDGYFFVCGISHNATTMTMQMEVKPIG